MERVKETWIPTPTVALLIRRSDSLKQGSCRPKLVGKRLELWSRKMAILTGVYTSMFRRTSARSALLRKSDVPSTSSTSWVSERSHASESRTLETSSSWNRWSLWKAFEVALVGSSTVFLKGNQQLMSLIESQVSALLPPKP